MFLKDNEKDLGYELRWRDRDSKILLKRNKVIGTVRNQNQLAFEIEAHERYLDVINRNKVELEDIDMMTTGQALVISVSIIALMTLALVATYMELF